jgi:tRNA pseudouridine38-40 synthase
MPRFLKITLAYDGTDFSGWQIQNNQRTVQAVVEEALATIHANPVPITAAGRTDTGVHATGQVIHFNSNKDNIPLSKFVDALNFYLPPDVRALTCVEVGSDFHARRSACLRIYKYYLYFSEAPLPHLRRYCVWRRNTPNLNLLNRLAAVLLGEHDFTSFSAAGDVNKSKRRTVVSSCFYPEGFFLVYKIAANAFLWKMVRSIVGTLLDLEANGASVDELKDILEAKNRNAVGPTVAARGLFLDRVVYNQTEEKKI